MSEMRDKVRKELVDYIKSCLPGDCETIKFQGRAYRDIVEDIVEDILNPKVFPKIAVVDREAELIPVIEQAFADVAGLSQEQHKNVIGDKRKFMDACVDALADWVKEVQ